MSDAQRRTAMAAATAVLDRISQRVEDAIRDRNALHISAATSEGAAAVADEISRAHPATLPWLLGQGVALRETARLSRGGVGASERAIAALLAEARDAAMQLERCQLQGNAAANEDGARAQKANGLEPRLGALRREADSATAATRVYTDLASACGAQKGRQHALASLVTLCLWRQWQMARTQRILALTVLRGTRALAKRERAAALEYTYAKQRDATAAELGMYSATPTCTLCLRPVVKRQLMSCDLPRLVGAVTRHLAADLAAALGVEEWRVEVRHTPDPAAAGVGDAVGIALLSEAGAADCTVAFAHMEACDEEDMPIELLRRTENGLFMGSLKLRAVYGAMGSSASGGAATPSDVELKVRSKHAPEPESVSVRRELHRTLEELRAKTDATRRELERNTREKVSLKATLAPGDEPPQLRDAKLAVQGCFGAQAACEQMINRLPPYAPGEDREVQFEWLPEVVRDQRLALAPQIKALRATLDELRPVAKSRAIAKLTMYGIQRTMRELRALDDDLPPTEPPVEQSGSMLPAPLHADYFHSRTMLAGRKSLAAALAKHAASLMAAFDRHVAELDAEAAAAQGHPFAGRLALDASVTLVRAKALMLLTDDTAAARQPITPERVLAMAERLGIVLSGASRNADAEPEYCLLWIAVEALRAPLPPLWRRRTEEAGGGFENLVTHEAVEEHPLRPVFIEHVVHERARKQPNRPFTRSSASCSLRCRQSPTTRRRPLAGRPRRRPRRHRRRRRRRRRGDAGRRQAAEGQHGFFFFNFETRQAVSGRRLPQRPSPSRRRAGRRRRRRRSASIARRRAPPRPSAPTTPLGTTRARRRRARRWRPAAARCCPRRRSPRCGSRRRRVGTPRSRCGRARCPRSWWPRMLDVDLVPRHTSSGLSTSPSRRSTCRSRGRPCGRGHDRGRADGQYSGEAFELRRLSSQVSMKAMRPPPLRKNSVRRKSGSGLATEASSQPHQPPRASVAAPAREVPREVARLPPLERLWHVARTGAPPSQFSHRMSSLVTERHPTHAFVRQVVLGSGEGSMAS